MRGKQRRPQPPRPASRQCPTYIESQVPPDFCFRPVPAPPPERQDGQLLRAKLKQSQALSTTRTANALILRKRLAFKCPLFLKLLILRRVKFTNFEQPTVKARHFPPLELTRGLAPGESSTASMNVAGGRAGEKFERPKSSSLMPPNVPRHGNEIDPILKRQVHAIPAIQPSRIFDMIGIVLILRT